jgi:signal transduction histidine kinase
VKVRTRLLLAFAYILLAVIVALEVPLALNLQRRALAEAEAQALAQAQVIAATVGSSIEDRGEADWDRIQDEVVRFVEETGADLRVIVVDEEGFLRADSSGTEALGQPYATPERPEIVSAVENDVPDSDPRFSDVEGREILATAAPIFVRGEPRGGAVRITQGMGEVRANVRGAILGLVAIGAAGLAAGLLIAFVVARSLSRPLGRLAAAATRLGSGDLSARAGGSGGASEIEEVAASFDEMAGRLEQAIRSQREFVANASHQLRTPLTGMKLRLESALADKQCPPDIRRQLEAADHEVDRLSGIVDRLLVLARLVETGAERQVDLRHAADRALARWGDRARQAGASLEVKGEGAVAEADPADLDQILDNMIDNAIAYAPGPVTVETGQENGQVFVAVRDRGPGIPEDERDRVVERFYRGHGVPAGGSGLGLAIVRELAGRWDGTVSVQGPAEGGTRIEVLLPAAFGSVQADSDNA